MIPQNKNVRQLVWHLYVDTAVGDSELYCYVTEGYRNSILSQASCRMDETRRLPHRWKQTVKLREISVRVRYFLNYLCMS
jgi:hypothetical protein